jgi:FkbM family methyltransferase
MNYDSPTPEVAVGYMRWMFERLVSQGVEINSVLDIGAAHGHFSGYLTRFYPNAEIVAVECNQRDSYFLSRYRWETHYKCLGAKPGVQTFYIDRNSEIGGGSSIYKENTPFFNNCIEESKEITTLDHEFPDRAFDFIKIDTQGSELDIMKGGVNVVSRAKWLLLELSFQDYNIGAPLIDDVLQYTRDNGWKMYDTIGPTDGGHCFGNKKIQVDVLLQNTLWTE